MLIYEPYSFMVPGLSRLIIQPESDGATIDEGFVVVVPVGDPERLLCHGAVCAVRGCVI